MFDENANIYDHDPELLFYRRDDEPKKEKLHFNKERWHDKKR